MVMNSDNYAYSKITGFKLFSYNCITHLLENNEMVWKLLFYNDADAWNKPDISKDQKRAMIYAGQPDETLFRVFMTEKQTNSWVSEATILRIFPYSVVPDNRTVNTTMMVFDAYSHYRIDTLSNYTTRVDSLVEEIVSTMNGAIIGGIGRLAFNSTMQRADKILESGQIPFGGKRIVMSNKQV
jgi:hypothetical protein